MNGWQLFWTVLFFGAIGFFAILAVVVTIGGFGDVKKMLATLGRKDRDS